MLSINPNNSGYFPDSPTRSRAEREARELAQLLDELHNSEPDEHEHDAPDIADFCTQLPRGDIIETLADMTQRLYD